VTFEFDGRTAFITGGAQGIGLGMARALARRGVRIALADINEVALASVLRELSKHVPTQTYVLDVRDRDAFARVANEVAAQLGSVSLLCNNAGVSGAVSPAKMTYEMWDWVMGINLTGVINGIQTFVPRMIAEGIGGHIVNTASGAGLAATSSGVLYTTSKYAVVGLSESLRLELARYNIGVSALCPGPVATQIIDNTEAQHPRPDREVPQYVADIMTVTKAYLHAGASPDDVGELVVEGIASNSLYIHTDDLMRVPVTQRMEELLRSIPDASESRAQGSFS
jgi:NAD(P)-dependent dehydrogenase (short-subunit alcohol dehydrogenase family)